MCVGWHVGRRDLGVCDAECVCDSEPMRVCEVCAVFEFGFDESEAAQSGSVERLLDLHLTDARLNASYTDLDRLWKRPWGLKDI